jgi:putative inorganic carbon (hco3(-)) transporter
MINFGLEGYLGIGLYVLAVILALYSIFKRPIAGLYVLVPMIPLQTIRYRLQDYPLGGSVVGLMLLAVAIGLLLRGRPVLARTPWNVVLIVFCVFTFLSLCWGSVFLRQPLPFLMPNDARFADWREYILMPAFLFLTAAAVENRRQILILVVLMCLGALAVDKSFWSTISDRDFSQYSDDLRDPGAMGYAGANGLAAFEAQFATFALVLASYEKRWLLRSAFALLTGLSVFCLMYSFSRGGYAALLMGFLFVGILKTRKLLVLTLLLGLVWTPIVPNAVRERVLMTYSAKDGGLDHSSEIRVGLWEDAIRVFDTSPVIGTGFNTYAYMGRVGDYTDTHNYFIKVLVETGVLGLGLFLILVFRLAWIGLVLHWRAADPMVRALGLGLAGWMVSSLVANLFGDRWSFLQVNGYMWVIAGLAARGWTLEQEQPYAQTDEELEQPETIWDHQPQLEPVLKSVLT